MFNSSDDVDSALTESTSVLIQDRKIASVGGRTEPEPETVVIDGGGRVSEASAGWLCDPAGTTRLRALPGDGGRVSLR
ncbi:hypothetical protein AB0L71_05065 [Streptomyces sp. NPDC052052]|uniref:hypothetical protein n=1 Tax=Streptomyces sp. NPDC052052 TaxID=3154756 RepID=UPI0034182291